MKTAWLLLSNEQRRSSLEEASVRSGIQSKAIEKDWWVTLSLKALFNTLHAPYCIFKGGTSLSKGWKLIQRFSEDVDIGLSPEAFGMEYQIKPTHSYVKKLKRLGCEFTSTVVKASLEKSFTELGVPEGSITIVAERVAATQRDKDPQTLLIRYTSVYETHPYLADEVKMEFGVRSLREPSAIIKIQSILSEAFPNTAYPETPFEILAVEPRKTLLEKLFLLHEKFSKDEYATEITGERQSRHLYDIAALIDTPAGQAVLDDLNFFDVLLEHRAHYVRLSWVNYQRLRPDAFRFVPSIMLLAELRKDYEQMQRSMIYGESPGFDDMIAALKKFNGHFRLMGTGLRLEDLIAQFLHDNKSTIEAEPGKNIFRFPITVTSSAGKKMTYEMMMYKRRGEWLLEEINL